jgi:hypothetical protein
MDFMGIKILCTVDFKNINLPKRQNAWSIPGMAHSRHGRSRHGRSRHGRSIGPVGVPFFRIKISVHRPCM